MSSHKKLHGVWIIIMFKSTFPCRVDGRRYFLFRLPSGLEGDTSAPLLCVSQLQCNCF